MAGNSCIIIISHSNYRLKCAGIEKFITEIANLLQKNDVQVLQFFPLIEVNKRTHVFGKEYMGVNYNGVFMGAFDEKKLFEILMMFAKKYRLYFKGIHINQLHGWNLSHLEKTIIRLELPVVLIVHDYEMICYAMLKHDGKGLTCRKEISKPNAIKCDKCKYLEKGEKRYKRVSQFLCNIRGYVQSVIAPSEIAGNNWISVYEDYADLLIIREHMFCEAIKNKRRKIGEKIRIAYIGSTSLHKGFKEWEKLIKEISLDNYDLYYFGKEKIKSDLVTGVYVDFQDGGNMTMSEQLVDKGINIVFLWSTWQETFCYTAYEACEAGCFILSNDYSGNISETIKRYNVGEIFHDLSECIDFLNNYKRIRERLTEFYNREYAVSFSPNESTEELLFEINARNHFSEQSHSKATYKVKREFIISTLYYLLRARFTR